MKEFNFIVQIIKKRIFLISIIFVIFISMVFYRLKEKGVFQVKFTIDSVLIRDVIKSRKDSKNDNENTYSKWILENIINNFNIEAKNKYAGLKTIELESTSITQSTYDYFRPLNITLHLYDTSHVAAFIDEMLAYINSTPYIDSCHKNEKERLTRKRGYYYSTLKEMESLSHHILNKNESKVRFNPFAYILSLKNKINDIDNRLLHYHGVKMIISPVTTYESPSKNFSRDLILYGILGLFTGIIISVFIEKIYNTFL